MNPPAYLRTPDTRARVIGYLATAPVAAPGFRTDGVFVWPQSLADAARDRGLAPPADLYAHMRQTGFLRPDTVAAELVAGAVATDPPDVGESDVDAEQASTQVYEALLRRDRERQPPSSGVRPARLFDGPGPDRTGWFSPRRLRIPEPARRARLAGYLSSGRLVRRATGEVPDPLDPRYRLRLGWRTDGAWVWPEALAHYVLTRGVAPELELLCHIEARGYGWTAVDEAGARAAAVAANRRPLPLPLRPVRYLRDRAGRLARVWGAPPSGSASLEVPADSAPRASLEVLRDDLRWGAPPEPVDDRGRVLGFQPIDEAEAVALLHERWARADAMPALD